MSYRKPLDTVPKTAPVFPRRTCKVCDYTWEPRIAQPKHCPYCKAWLCREKGETPNE
jgi:rubrerythrin